MKKYMRASLYSSIMVTSMLWNAAFAAHTYTHTYNGPGDYWHTDYKSEMIPPCPCPCNLSQKLQSGLYIGAGTAYNSYRVRKSGVLEDPIDGDLMTVNQTVSPIGESVSLFGGYGQYYDWFYIAGEIFAKFNNASTSDALVIGDTTYNTNITMRNTYGISIIPGVKLTNSSLFFLRFGAMRTMIKTQEYGIGIGPVGTAYSEPRSPWGNGISFGGGIETAVYKSLSLRLDYNHTSYAAFTTLLGTKFSPSNDEVTLGLLYHFDLVC